MSWSTKPIFTMQSVGGRRAQGIPQVIHALQWFDIKTLSSDRPIIALQWFGQRFELYREDKEIIRNEWLAIPRDRFCKPDDDAIVVHVRKGDYVWLDDAKTVPADPMLQGTATTAEEFSACIAQFPDAKRLVIVTDDPVEAAAMEWPLPFVVQSEAWDIDFLTLASARWVCLSQSTYSWLAAFLGRAEKIVAPVFPGTFWGNGVGLQGPQTGPGGRDFPNLYPFDESERWVFVDSK